MRTHKYLSCLFLAHVWLAVPALANPWVGTYSDHSGTKDYFVSLVRKITITEMKDHHLIVRIVIHSFLADAPTRPITLESTAQGYYDVIHKGARETLICSFPTAKYKPLVVIQRDSPFESILNQHSRFKHLSYTFYESSDSPRFVSGDVYRDAAPEK